MLEKESYRTHPIKSIENECRVVWLVKPNPNEDYIDVVIDNPGKYARKIIKQQLKYNKMKIKTLLEFCNENELKNYKAEFIQKNKVEPEVANLTKGKKLHNPSVEDETSKRRAYNGVPWIKYWQAFSGNSSNKLQCSCCGKVIFVDIEKSDCQIYVNNNYDPSNPITKDDLQAVGGHFYKNGRDNSDGYIIIPICKECNRKSSDDVMNIKVENKYVSEEAANIDND